MKKWTQKWMGILLAVLLFTSVIPVNEITTQAAAVPSLSLTTKALTGIGSAFTVTIKNLDNTKVKSKVWYTTNKSIITVDSKTGYVTSTGKGTAYVKCKITYKDGTILRPACKVTVKIKATAIDITNTPEDGMDYFVLTKGEVIDFNSALTPSNASDLITYTIDDTNYATVDKKGIVTALKPGLVILTATASLTKAGVSSSLVKDTVKIQIVEKTAGVKTAVLTDTNTLTITFDNAVEESTVLDGTSLSDSVSIKAMTDKKGKTADALGDLTGSLSSDGKVLSIVSENAFNGLYGLHLSDSIKTTGGTALTEYYKNLELYDTKPPYYKNYKIDDTGLVVTLEFSKPMDFSKMAISKVSLVKSNQTAETATLNYLKTKTNYVKSDDNKFLTIDLSDIDTDDQNKTFSVVFSGLKDKNGNYPSNSVITAYVATDTTEKSQAKLKTLTRTGYNTLTATFTRSIKIPGDIELSNGKTIEGEVDKDDKTIVNYTLDATSAKLTGSQKVSIGYWDSYNVKSSDSSAEKYITKTVNFNVSSSGPKLKKNKLTKNDDNDVITYILTLTFDKAVVLPSNSGKFSSKLITLDNDIYSQKDLGYTATVKDEVVTVEFDKKQFDENGTYTITIPEGFVKDKFNNKSVKTTVTVNRSGSIGSELPAPASIEQSSEDPNIIYVNFDNKVDKITAENANNYSIKGAKISKAELVENNSTGATVQLTLKTGSVTVTATFVVTIKGIKGYNNSFTEMNDYETTILLSQNVGPTITNITYEYPDTIILTFDMNIKGTASFSVTQGGKEYAQDFNVDDDTVTITLSDTPVMKKSLKITPTSANNITDEAGNKAVISTKYVTPK
ncbi:Ig-like domain-containing protein [Anaerocolumna sp. MB42-C2]|uniref:Ig-like domain-containing protein n=1 Tax=Anaerocolumna sp. MB42-C2 TaxID=3070997 RepID=UPI0027DFF94E|nr:Ig-like domain-containing protein [Anaerocolumna sp. MB42-C2]WMJ89642.1 Ig-like domain-containing protein [Anaerocolumna sp. MB42-C2]